MKIPAATPVRPNEHEERIKHLPAEARAAFAQFQAKGDPAVIDPMVLAILEDFIPKAPDQPLAQLPGSTRLFDDLGFDSLAITEVVFFTEELFGITITNDEILQVRTLDDLRGFIRAKLAARAPR
jgi:acyl carrier protein